MEINNKSDKEVQTVKTGLIMLAAGNSRRFGSNKLLHEIEGKPMYLHVLEQLLKVQKQTENCKLSVVTQYMEVKETAEKSGAEVYLNPDPERGIASSLVIGLEASRETDCCLFAVADQPWLTAETILKLLEVYRGSGKGMAAVKRKEMIGNPCVFSRKYYPELLHLTGDKGGKKILKKHLEDVTFLEITEERELLDVDVPL